MQGEPINGPTLFVRTSASLRQAMDEVVHNAGSQRKLSLTMLTNRALELYMAEHFGYEAPVAEVLLP